MPATMKSLEERVDDLEENISHIKVDVHSVAMDFAAFKAKIETIVSLLKWLGVFVAGLTAATLFNMFSIAYSASKLESSVDQLRITIHEQERSNRELEKQVARLQGLKDKP